MLEFFYCFGFDLPDPFGGDLAPSNTGVFHVDLASGESKLILSLKAPAEMIAAA